MRCVCLTAVVFTLVLAGIAAAEEKTVDGQLPPPAERTIAYATDVEPLLRKMCYSCHGPEVQESGLRLDDKKRALEGGDLGVVIVPGKSAESRLIRVVAGTDDDIGQMPPDGEGTLMTAAEIGVLRAWIDQGANWPDAGPGSTLAVNHWSLKPITRTAPPAVKGTADVASPIDHFIVAQLQSQKIAPAPPADRVTLMRRLYLDLLGLLPSPEEVDAFVADPRPDAIDRLVDRLMASPRFGERWGRHWLDLARYADSDGYEKDKARPFAWRYRDWVIAAINADMPYDRFTIEQIAGDMLPNATLAQKTATGFHRNTLHNTEGGIDPEEDRVKKTVDRTNTVGTVWLGLTVGCAQCHTHKYDPITQREYFSLYAFFDSINEVDPEVPTPAAPAPTTPESKTELVAATTSANTGSETKPAPKKKSPPVNNNKVQAVAELAEPRVTKIHLRGDFLSPGDAVQPATLAVLPPLKPRGDRPDRVDLAHWLVDPANPLTPRVEANRVWQHLFGRGLVFTSDDLGRQGDPPSHPELLDWLAAELVEEGWSVKELIRAVVLSATYQQSSAARLDLVAIDPENTLVARQSRRRVEAEVIRDLGLEASGLLTDRIGGPSVRPPQPSEYSGITYAGSAKWVVSQGADRYRRGLYTFFQRTSPYPMLGTFDAPDSNECKVRRQSSNTPLQALTLWNDPVFFECAQQLGRRIVADVPAAGDARQTAVQRAERGFRLCLSRSPSQSETTALVSLYDGHLQDLAASEAAARSIIGAGELPAGTSPAELAAWVGVGRTLLNLDEFITRE